MKNNLKIYNFKMKSLGEINRLKKARLQIKNTNLEELILVFRNILEKIF